MEMKKMTKAQKYDLALSLSEVKANPVLVEFFEHEKELLAKKNASDKKPTATQIANEGIKAEIVELMADGKQRTVTEIMKSVPSLTGASNQKATSLVRQLVFDDKALERVEIKGRAYFVKVAD